MSKLGERFAEGPEEAMVRRRLYVQRTSLIRVLALPVFAALEDLGRMEDEEGFLERITHINGSEVKDELGNMRELRPEPYLLWNAFDGHTVNRRNTKAVQLANADPIIISEGGALPRRLLLEEIEDQLAIEAAAQAAYMRQGRLLQLLLPSALETPPAVQ